MSQPSPTVRLILERREHPGLLRRRISIRAAAKRAAELSGEMFSEPTWRRIENGEKRDEDIADREIVFMAAAINDLANDVVISPDDLDQVGRPQAADLFRSWIRERTKADPALSAIDPDLTPESVQQTLQTMLSEIRALQGVSAAERAQMEKVLLAQLEATIKAHGAQLRILRPR
ncbi:hypothetical protein ACFV0L_18785 [Streptosporangium canum]|uniref:hypothetical protein n=1 Tax=Streptosporangium canum TaxID=324952 RepID=UPI0036937112